MRTMYKYAAKSNGSDRLNRTYRVHKVLIHALYHLVAIQIVPNRA